MYSLTVEQITRINAAFAKLQMYSEAYYVDVKQIEKYSLKGEFEITLLEDYDGYRYLVVNTDQGLEFKVKAHPRPYMTRSIA